MAPFLYAVTLPILTDFKNYFNARIRRKFVIILSLQIPPHLKCVATLPCQGHSKQRNRLDSSPSCLGATCQARWTWLITPQVRQCVPGSLFMFNIWSINVNDSRQSTSWSRRSSLSGANCRSVSLIAPLVSDVAGINASSSSKADTLNNVKTVRCDSYFRQ